MDKRIEELLNSSALSHERKEVVHAAVENFAAMQSLGIETMLLQPRWLPASDRTREDLRLRFAKELIDSMGG